MILDDTIVQKYLAGQPSEDYKDYWIYNSHIFQTPNISESHWVSQLSEKLINQVKIFEPRNAELVKKLFPDLDVITKNYTLMLVVGFPDPYDAMVLEHEGKEYMIFDLIQFGKESLNENYSCHRVLTHELIHMCLHNKYPIPSNMSYLDELSYIAFDEGFAHALSYPENIESFCFDSFLEKKYDMSRETLKKALVESDIKKMNEYSTSADTGDYWDKFASISGKLYLLKNKNEIFDIYNAGWKNFAEKILGDI